MQSNRWQIFSVLVAVVLVGAAVYLYLQEPSTLPAPSTTESPSDRALDAEGYTGAESCRECHQAESETWSKSAHARAMTIASSETVRGEWNTTHTFDGQTYRMFTRDGRYFIEAPNREGQPEAYPVVYTLGARQHENYLTRFPDGRYQVLPVYYDLHQKRWYDAAEGTLVDLALGGA